MHPYGHRSRLLHWVSVALVVAVYIYSGQFGDAPAGEVEQRRVLHTSFGLLLLALMIVRVWWRTRTADPLTRYSLPTHELFFARCIHLSIYTLLLAQCLVGGLVLLFGEGSSFFGLLEIAALPNANPDIASALMPVHWALAQVMLVLIGVHFLAAIAHLIFGVTEPTQ